jgi:hypothetical protein
MCTITGPFYGGMVQKHQETTPVKLTDEMLKNMKGLQLLLEPFEFPIGEILETWFDEKDQWWHLRASLTIPVPEKRGLAIDSAGVHYPNGKMYNARIRKVWIVDDPLDPKATFVVI